MKTVPSLYEAEPLWQPLEQLSPNELSPSVYSWLSESGSLTERLKQHCQYFSLKLILQDWGKSLPTEANALQMAPTAPAMVREVALVCDEKPCIFARTIIPAATYAANEASLVTLGTTPIGNLLFADTKIQRSQFEVALVKPGDYLFHLVWGDTQPVADCWSRRSIFFLAKHPLLITEVFVVT